LGAVLPPLAALQAQGIARADLTLRIENHSLQDVQGSVELKNGHASLSPTLRLSEINGAVQCSGREFTADKVSLQMGGETLTLCLKVALESELVQILPSLLRGFGGAIAISGTLFNNPAKSIETEITAANLDLAKVLAATGKEGAFSLQGTLADAKA